MRLSLNYRILRKMITFLPNFLGRHVLLSAMFAVVALTWIVLAQTGEYLEEKLFMEPVSKGKKKLGLQPVLDASIKLIVLDDRSYLRLGRQPYAEEWQEVINLLAKANIETVIIQEPLDFPPNSFEMPRKDKGLFVVGSIVHTGASKTSRSVEIDQLPESMLIKGYDAQMDQVQVIKYAISPHQSLLENIDALGVNRVESETSINPIYITEMKSAIPYLGLLAAGPLTFKNGQFVGPAGALPRSTSNRYFVDYAVPQSIADSSIPFNLFFDFQSRRIKSALTQTLEDKLIGAKIAIIVPSAFTGSRYLTSPADGLVPAYFALASMASSTLTNFYIRQSVAPEFVVAIGTIVFILLLRFAPTFRAIATGFLGAITIITLLGVWSFVKFGLVFPVVHLVVILCAIWGTKAVYIFLKSLQSEAILQQEMMLANTVQSTLFPQKISGESENFRFRIFHKSFLTMSGDWYQTFEHKGSDHEIVFVAIGDVVGKGASAALVTATVAGVWKSCFELWQQEGVDIASFVKKLNLTLYLTYNGQQNTTFTAALKANNQLYLVSCAGPGWLKIDENRKVTPIKHIKCNPIGAVREIEFPPPMETVVGPGNLFFCYTDGVMEGGPARKKMVKSIDEVSFAGPEERVFEEIFALAERCGVETSLPDDKTMLIFNFGADGRRSALDSGVQDAS